MYWIIPQVSSVLFHFCIKLPLIYSDLYIRITKKALDVEEIIVPFVLGSIVGAIYLFFGLIALVSEGKASATNLLIVSQG